MVICQSLLSPFFSDFFRPTVKNYHIGMRWVVVLCLHHVLQFPQVKHQKDFLHRMLADTYVTLPSMAPHFTSHFTCPRAGITISGHDGLLCFICTSRFNLQNLFTWMFARDFMVLVFETTCRHPYIIYPLSKSSLVSSSCPS